VKLRWSRAALDDLASIRRHVARDDPMAARRVGGRILSAAERLLDHPASGRTGRIPETRELVVAALPYVIPYRVRGEEVQILRVLHAARVWPDEP
jgi:toxin ParE1/3/4